MTTGEILDYQATPPTSFVGRRIELAEARRLLGTTRLLTLVGSGGTGKTRLALRLAADVRRQYGDGVCFVPLAELRDPARLVMTVAEHLQLRDQPGRAPLETVTEHLAERDLLLVLDNCEHVIEEASRFVDVVIRTCRGVRVLATSRQSLRVAGEVAMHVPPMVLGEAVDLFSDRVTAALPSFTVNDSNAAPIARICERLDGLPLAIELAAARVRVLSPAQIESRLDARYRLLTRGGRDTPRRQQTLRAMVDWSWDLCTAEEHLLWSRASVFSGGFDLDAAEHVCAGDGIEAHDVLDLVDSLTDKSILLADDHDGAMRYRMLETLREYGAERLGTDTVIRRRHRDWGLQLARTSHETWESTAQLTLVARLIHEQANLRVALDFCLTASVEVTAGFQIATLLDDYWGMRGMHTDLRHWFDRALQLDTTASPQRAAALRMSGWYALLQGDAPNGLALLTTAGEEAAAVGDRVTAAYVVHAWGMAAMFSGDYGNAEVLMSQALAEFRELGEVRGQCFTLFSLGLSVGTAGHFERGLALLDECLAETGRRGEGFWRSWALWSVCLIEVARGGLVRADDTGKQALGLQRALDNRLGIAFGLDALAWVAEQEGRYERSATLFGAASSAWEALGSAPGNYAPVGPPHDQHIAAARDSFGTTDFDAAFKRGHALSRDAALSWAMETETAGAAPPPHPAGGAGHAVLTPRESEIASLVAEGLTNKQIAARLVISARTAEGHVEHILVKLGLRSRSRIAAWHRDATEKR
jgi:predicted ATPase/DNA-binding CsgD family transcriptional regulator